MRHTPFTAVLDANVLYPAPLRDLLMHLALTGAYRARWSAQIHDEWKRNVLAKRPDLTREQLDRTSALMDKHVPDSVVSGYEPLVNGIDLPDLDDRHVAAAAIKCSASVIVTFNLKDFPEPILEPFGIEALHPDEFLSNQWSVDSAAVLQAAQRQRATLKKPPVNADQYLDTLLALQLPETVNLLSKYKVML